MQILFWFVIYIALWMVLAYQRAALSVWTIAFGVLLLVQTLLGSVGGSVISWAIFIVIALALNIVPLRRFWLSKNLFSVLKSIMPSMSTTEQEALSAGTVGWEGECFSGMPDFVRLQSIPPSELSEEEQAFIDGPTETLCTMLSDWEITHTLGSLPDVVWSYIKAHGFLGLIIPKSYGGLAFSALAHSQIITKLAGVSISVATSISVPNSLGPAELILHYGTKEQKDYYLPRLAQGLEIPCFALTSAVAGSDASSMQDTGVICERQFEGKKTLGVLLNWNKRYITLAPIATLLGLAFKCYDPNHLLGKQEELGISCALIPTTTPGVVIGRRHFPLNSAFANGPTRGQDVFIPLEWVIGGRAMLGHGWRMLMECLAAGRGISLPSMVVGGAKLGALASGVYARCRRQFNTAIAHFEGVEEALARIAGYSYIMDATRFLTLAMIDQGEKPAVASAISKYHITELARQVTMDMMDIHGGKGICLGPSNYLGRGYQQSPISITVEGANILTRSMIIFGQGAIRCHPYMLKLMQLVQEEYGEQILREFDDTLTSHIGYLVSNMMRCWILGMSSGWLSSSPKGQMKRYYQKLTRYCAAFAHVTDICMMALGRELKRREKISARLGDCLSWLYIGSGLMRHFENGGGQKDEWPALQWAIQQVFYHLQEALDGIIRNFPNRALAFYMRCWVFPLGRRESMPSDRLGHQLVKKLIAPSHLRDRLAKDMYMTPNDNNIVGQMCAHLKSFIDVENLESKLNKAQRQGVIKAYDDPQLIQAAQKAQILTQEQAQQLLRVNQLREQFNAVDDFALSQLALGARPIERES